MDQVNARLWQLERQIKELETKLTRMEHILRNIDGNTAQTANMVRDLQRRA